MAATTLFVSDTNAPIATIHDVAAVALAVHPSGVDRLGRSLTLSDVLAPRTERDPLRTHSVAKASAVLRGVAEVSVVAHVLRVKSSGLDHLRVTLKRRKTGSSSFRVCDGPLFAFDGRFAIWIWGIRRTCVGTRTAIWLRACVHAGTHIGARACIHRLTRVYELQGFTDLAVESTLLAGDTEKQASEGQLAGHSRRRIARTVLHDHRGANRTFAG